MTREMLKGNEAMAEAAMRAGVRAYSGYPSTPQSELLEHMVRRLPELGRVFPQAESEVAAINMVYGAAAAGAAASTGAEPPSATAASNAVVRTVITLIRSPDCTVASALPA